MPVPARREISSSGAPAPCSTNTSRAAATIRLRFSRASARSGLPSTSCTSPAYQTSGGYLSTFFGESGDSPSTWCYRNRRKILRIGCRKRHGDSDVGVTQARRRRSQMNTQDLRKGFRGPVHRPGDEHYDTQRAAFNPSLDARPVLVAEATSPSDVSTAVPWARTNDLPLPIQATGHGTRVPSTGGLLVKTTRMATVLVDPDRRIAKVGPGARWGEVIAAAAPFGLAPLSGTS